MSGVEDYLERLLEDKRYAQNIVSTSIKEARDAEYRDFPSGLNPALITLSQSLGLSRLYAHQAEAITLALKG
ncbi:MAG: hypothetical protein PHT47_07365, partial [Candidatus Cloacimonetes bacterium]|nr:hypothetical protein [Candidatus Cloacimonadota bacterium]